MAWYLRKSLSCGPLRLNLSRGGIGLSTGVRGLRFGITPRGQQYVHCGRGGIYCKKVLNSRQRRGPGLTQVPPQLPGSPSSSLGPVRQIDSGDVSRMIDSSAADLLTDIKRRAKLWHWHRVAAVAAVLTFLVGVGTESDAAVVAAAITLFLIVPLLWLVDRHRKRIVRQYHLDPQYTSDYRQLVAAFDQLRRCDRIWVLESEQTIHERKYHAGASRLIRKERVKPAKRLPPNFVSNIKPLMLPAGRQTLYLFPDTILILEGSTVGAIGWNELIVTCHTTQFIEEESLPRDAQLVGQTWRCVNKQGAPDRRFRNNRRLPVVEYGALELRSHSGLYERFHISSASVASDFAVSLVGFSRVARSITALRLGQSAVRP